MEKLFGLLSAIWSGTTIVFFSIWCGVYFGIYYYFLQEYAPATCSVFGAREYKSLANNRFRLLFVNVFIDGEAYQGFSCEADSYEYPEVIYDNNFGYAYQYSYCEYWMYESGVACEDDEIIIPRWICTKWSSTSAFQYDNLYDCNYKLRFGGDGPLKDENLSTDIVRYSLPFIEVIFKDKPYIPWGSYMTLMILCLGICSIFPFILFVFVGLPGICNFWIYKRIASFLLHSWYWMRSNVLCCWKFYNPFLVVEDRKTLFRHAAVTSSKIKFKPKILKKIDQYLE